MTVGEWLDKWAEDYLGSVKPATVCAYKATIKTHLKPGLGAVKLSVLDTPIIQNFYNNLISPQKNKKPASPKTVKNTHGVLHKALQQAVSNGHIRITHMIRTMLLWLAIECMMLRVHTSAVFPVSALHSVTATGQSMKPAVPTLSLTALTSLACFLAYNITSLRAR